MKSPFFHHEEHEAHEIHDSSKDYSNSARRLPDVSRILYPFQVFICLRFAKYKQMLVHNQVKLILQQSRRDER